MGKDFSDDEDDRTETDVDLDPSLISAITVTRSGDEALTANASTASGADSEPRTLQPGLAVRGLAPSSVGHVPGSVELPGGVDARRVDDGDGDGDGDKTTNSIDARLLEAYSSGRSVQRVIARPAATLRSPIITPSEPFRTTSPKITEMPAPGSAQPAPRRVAPIPAAGRPPEGDPDLGEPTQKREPYALADESSSADDVDDETATDALREAIRVDAFDVTHGATLQSAGERGDRVDRVERDDRVECVEEEEDETRTRQDVGGALRSLDGGGIGSLPAVRRDLVGLDEARMASRSHPASSVSVPVAAAAAAMAADQSGSASASGSGPGTPGATIRMLFNASLGAVTIDPALRDTVAHDQRSPRASPALPTFPSPPTAPAPAPAVALVADPQLQSHAPLPPAAAVRRPPTPRFDPLAKPKRRRGRKLFYFVLLLAAFGGGFHYRRRITPWVLKHAPSSWVAWIAPAAPAPTPPVADPVPSASTSTSAVASAVASASAVAVASASASASASSHPPKKRPKR